LRWGRTLFDRGFGDREGRLASKTSVTADQRGFRKETKVSKTVFVVGDMTNPPPSVVRGRVVGGEMLPDEFWFCSGRYVARAVAMRLEV
jgi:hypothetical protein